MVNWLWNTYKTSRRSLFSPSRRCGFWVLVFAFAFCVFPLELGDPIPVGSSTDRIGSLVECTMQRFRRSGTSILGSLSAPNLRRKAQNSWAAMQDTFFSTKDTFERHRVVFTVGTSIASVATAWIGYSLRHLHDSKVDQRLESIERAMKNNYDLEHTEIRKIVGTGGCSIPACVATAGTTLIIGYGLGWRSGSWYANKRFRKEQMKMLGQIKPRRWQLLPGQIKARARGWQFQFLRRPLTSSKVPETAVAETSETKL